MYHGRTKQNPEETLSMIRNSLIASFALAFAATTAQAQTEIQWWHSMTGGRSATR